MIILECVTFLIESTALKRHISKMKGPNVDKRINNIAFDLASYNKTIGNANNFSLARPTYVPQKDNISGKELNASILRDRLNNIPNQSYLSQSSRGTAIDYNFRKLSNMVSDYKLGGQIKDIDKREDSVRFVKRLRKTISKSIDGDPERYVDIAHGGDKRLITNALNTGNRGYALEKNRGVGLQFNYSENPNISPRNDKIRTYANRTGDNPAVLLGKIKAKYLIKNGDPSETGESGVSMRNLKHITNPKIIDI